MAALHAKMTVDPDWIRDLNAGLRIWRAAHDDGSADRINGEAVLEAASYHTIFGILTALGMWFRKKFRKRGMTKADLAAEREAAEINRTCAALDVMMKDYLLAASEGRVEQEALDELTGVLAEMDGYDRAGKLALPGRAALQAIRERITAFTADFAGAPAAPEPGAGEFRLIRDQLLRQQDLLRPAAQA